MAHWRKERKPLMARGSQPPAQGFHDCWSSVCLHTIHGTPHGTLCSVAYVYKSFQIAWMIEINLKNLGGRRQEVQHQGSHGLKAEKQQDMECQDYRNAQQSFSGCRPQHLQNESSSVTLRLGIKGNLGPSPRWKLISDLLGPWYDEDNFQYR